MTHRVVLVATGLFFAATAGGIASVPPGAGAPNSYLASTAASGGAIVMARRGADDPPGDNRGGRGRGKHGAHHGSNHA